MASLVRKWRSYNPQMSAFWPLKLIHISSAVMVEAKKYMYYPSSCTCVTSQFSFKQCAIWNWIFQKVHNFRTKHADTVFTNKKRIFLFYGILSFFTGQCLWAIKTCYYLSWHSNNFQVSDGKHIFMSYMPIWNSRLFMEFLWMEVQCMEFLI